MITIRKLKTLKESTRFRKYIVILQDLEIELKLSSVLNTIYYNTVLYEIKNEKNLSDKIKKLSEGNLTIRNINNLKHSIMHHLSIEPSEWDFIAPLDKTRDSVKIQGLNLYLEDIRSPFNLGSLFRSGECFGISQIYLSTNCTSPLHPRAKRTSMGCIDLVNWKIADIKELKLPIFALELGGTSIDEFNFPREGIAIIGSEELGVSPEALKLADNSLGRVTIPLYGSKSSLNVASATAILLQRWSEEILKG